MERGYTVAVPSRASEAHPLEAGRRMAPSQSWKGWKTGSQQAEDEGVTEALRQGEERCGTLESDLIVLAWEVNGFRQQSNLV